jgi:hypothetical protein
MKPKHLISIGMRHGNLTVTGEDGHNAYGCRMFKCRCDCGADVLMRATHLYPTRRYCTRKCPLLATKRIVDLTGKRFGRWMVGSYAGPDARNDARWNCACDCGTERVVRGFMLSNGESESCGCAESERRATHRTPEEELDVRRLRSRLSNRKHPARVKAAKIKYMNKLAKATPSWLTPNDLKAMNIVYEKARAMTRESGIRHEVDHVIPINGKTVSGLHVPWNLQVLTQSANVSKSNRYAELLGD